MTLTVRAGPRHQPLHGGRQEAALRVVAVVISYNSANELSCSLPLLITQPGIDQIVVVDNASTDDSAEIADRFGVTVVRNATNAGFGGGANRGAAEGPDADVYVFLNPDALPAPGCLDLLARAVAASGGVAGPVLRTGDSGQSYVGTRLDVLAMPIEMIAAGRPLYVQGCALAIGAPLFRRIGGFDERYFLFAEDVELCLRSLRAGANVEVIPGAVVHHIGGANVPGGYVRDGRRQIADLRFSLRERNTLAMMIANAPFGWLAVFLPLHIAKVVALALLFRVLGRRELSTQLAEGLVWNRRELGRSLVRRRALVPSPGWWLGLRGRVTALALVDHVRRDGWPTFVGSSPIGGQPATQRVGGKG